MAGYESFEAALQAAEQQTEAALKAAAAVNRELKKAKVAAAGGQARDLRRSLEAAEAAAGAVAEAAERARAGFDFDEQSHLSSGGYVKELLATAAEAGLAMFEEDDRLLCYPSLVRVLPSESAVEVDKKRERRLRPSVLVRHLQDAQARAPRFRPEPFLESLLAAYELVVARDNKKYDAVVRLVDVWAVLTLLPGQSRDYTRQEFARDLYLLDQSGVATARNDRVLRWSASTGTKGTGTLTTVAKSGQQQRYWGIAFS